MSYDAPFLKLKTANEDVVISVSEVGANLNMNSEIINAKSNLLTMIISAVQECAENITRRNFLTSEWTQLISCFPVATSQNPKRMIQLEKSPFQSISEIKYLKNDETTEVVIDPTIYYPFKSADYASVLPVPNGTWPSDVSLRLQTISLTFKSGYGDKSKNVPKSLRLAMLRHVAYFYANRGDCECSASNAEKIAPAGSMTVYKNYQILFMAL